MGNQGRFFMGIVRGPMPGFLTSLFRKRRGWSIRAGEQKARPKIMSPSLFRLIAGVFLLGMTDAEAGKHRILVRLRDPLKAETVKIRLSEVKNLRGETRDLETTLDLRQNEKKEQVKTESPAFKLGMSLGPI